MTRTPPPSDERDLHVLVVIDSLTAGGAEMLLSDFAAGAPDAGLRLSVGYLAEVEASAAAARLRRAGIEPVRIPYHGLLNPATMRSVRDHVASVAPDIVHTHLDYADAFGGLAARSLSVPSVCTVHVMEWRPTGSRERIRHALFRTARRRSAAAVIAVSDASREAMISAGLGRPDRIVTIRNGVDAPARPGAGKGIREELGIQPDELVVSQIAVLRRGKGHALAAAAFSKLLDRGVRARLLLVGDGPDREEVERAMEPLGDRALALGHRDDVMAILDASDLVVAPSEVDAFPTVLLEALAASVPVVATAVGGIPEIVADGETGTLVAPRADAEELATALAGVLEDAKARARFGQAARARYEAQFTATAWARRTRELYSDVLAGRTPGRGA